MHRTRVSTWGADSQGRPRPGVLVEGETDRVVGAIRSNGKPETVWTDEGRAKTQAVLDAALPGMVNTLPARPMANGCW